MFESLTPHTKDKRPFLKVRIGNESNGKFLDVQDAIWDTGATQTCISRDIAEALELQMYGKGYATTANGDASFSTAHCVIIMPDSGCFELSQVLVNLSTNLKGHVLIGQDIMQHGLTMVDVVKDKDNKLFTRLRFIPNQERK